MHSFNTSFSVFPFARIVSVGVTIGILFGACAPPATTGPTGSTGNSASQGPTTVAETKQLAGGGDCSAASGAGTTVSGDITTDTTWTPQGSPYRLSGNIRIRGATLTLTACTVVLLAENNSITIGASPQNGKMVLRGELTSNGETVRPVVLAAADENKKWGSLVVDSTGLLDAEIAVLVNAASPSSAQNGGGAVLAYGDQSAAITRNVRAVGLFVLGSGGHGINLQRRAAFSQDSVGLVVAQSGGTASPYPIVLEAGAAQSLPTELYLLENTRNDILLTPYLASSPSDTIHDRGYPYVIPSTLYVGASTDGVSTTLTIEPGVTLKFKKAGGNGLTIGNSDVRPGVLVARGTAEKKITFSSAEDTPSAGDWLGLYFRYTSAGSAIEHAIIEYTGSPSGAQGYGCGPAENDASILLLVNKPTESFIKNTTFRNVGGDTQIVTGWLSDDLSPDFAATNTFAATPACGVSRPRRDNNGCPTSPNPECYR